MSQKSFENREIYRRFMIPTQLVNFVVSIDQSDLHISAASDLGAEARRLTLEIRGVISGYIAAHPGFGDALEPWPDDPGANQVIQSMINAGQAAGTGPMAAVAGAVAGCVGRGLLSHSREVIVENGGDVFMAGLQPMTAAIFAGDSPLSMKLGLRLPAAPQGLGLCTSSGTVGPSLSYGRADAAVCLADDICLADAVATALGNRIKKVGDLKAAIDWVGSIPGIDGALAILGEDLAVCGNIELLQL
jgi:uncharacterized protein